MGNRCQRCFQSGQEASQQPTDQHAQQLSEMQRNDSQHSADGEERRLAHRLDGTWMYGENYMYTLQTCGSAYKFTDFRANGTVRFEGTLNKDGAWYAGEVSEKGQVVASLRVQKRDPNVVSQVRKEQNQFWENEVTATLKETRLGIGDRIVVIMPWSSLENGDTGTVWPAVGGLKIVWDKGYAATPVWAVHVDIWYKSL